MTGFTRRVLIPAAGFGKRVGEPPAKELLLDPETGRPLIDFALTRAQEAEASAMVIARREKIELINEMRARAGVEVCIIDGSKEWPDTLLQSSALWLDGNIVLLPDTRFAPVECVTQIFGALESGAEIAFGVFNAENLSTWGVVTTNEDFQLCEKPRKIPTGVVARPWGIFGFRKAAGVVLLNAMLESTFDHKWKRLPSTPKILELEKFEDLTRGRGQTPFMGNFRSNHGSFP